jgi:hypothetical protein
MTTDMAWPTEVPIAELIWTDSELVQKSPSAPPYIAMTQQESVLETSSI